MISEKPEGPLMRPGNAFFDDFPHMFNQHTEPFNTSDWRSEKPVVKYVAKKIELQTEGNQIKNVARYPNSMVIPLFDPENIKLTILIVSLEKSNPFSYKEIACCAVASAKMKQISFDRNSFTLTNEFGTTTITIK